MGNLITSAVNFGVPSAMPARQIASVHPDFLALTAQLDLKFSRLMALKPIVAEQVPTDTPLGGVYLFSENNVALYAGRTKRKIGVRIRSHFNTAPDCAFAWLLARDVTGFKATYRTADSRIELLKRPAFRAAYDAAKLRIRKMHVRYVHEADPLRQTLLEVYVAVVAQAKHNDFETH
ncbi:MAG TPA: hypothetical protein VG734_12430 [Lacunisphaera sp.]|nr:hypothetical protein [Lacunisphaera sp.]